MSLWMYEMKKLFFYQKGLLCISVFFILSTINLIFFDKPKNPEMDIYFQPYSYYLQQLNGELSDEKEQFLKDESEQISDAHTALDKAYNDFYDGKITKNELEKIIHPLEKIVENEAGFQVIFDQYTYIRENPNNRYFLETNGWDSLLSTDYLDLLFVLLLLVLVTPVFCSEYASEMDTLHLTVKKGNNKQAIVKILVILITIILLGILTALLRYGFFHIKYGLENGHYPLQSLSYFENSSKQISLFTTFMLVTILKIFGALSFAIFIMLISVWTKKYALTLFASTVLLLLPYYGFNLASTKYFLPSPLSFMIATGFFKGNEYELNILTDQMDLLFREISIGVLITLVFVLVTMNFLSVIFILKKHTNVWSVRKLNKPLKMTMMMFLLSLFASGCNPENEQLDKNEIYNYSMSHSFETDRYYFYLDETDLDDRKLVFEDKQTGIVQNMSRNPIQSLSHIKNGIYGNGDRVYYMKTTYEKTGMREMESLDKFFIMEIDTNTFTERVIFEKNINVNNDHFLGLYTVDMSELSFYNAIDAFFLDEENIYFIDSKEIRRVNRFTGNSEVIINSPRLTSVAFDGHTIYYINEKYQVTKFDTQTDSETVLPNIITTSFLLTESELLYLNRQDAQKIYALNLKDASTRKITDKPVLSFTYDNEYIYFENKVDLKNYRIDRDGQNETLIEK